MFLPLFLATAPLYRVLLYRIGWYSYTDLYVPAWWVLIVVGAGTTYFSFTCSNASLHILIHTPSDANHRRRRHHRLISISVRSNSSTMVTAANLTLHPRDIARFLLLSSHSFIFTNVLSILLARIYHASCTRSSCSTEYKICVEKFFFFFFYFDESHTRGDICD